MNDDIPSINEVLNAFAYETVTIRAHGIEQDYVIDILMKDRSKTSVKQLTGRIRSVGAPRRIAETTGERP